MKSDELEVKYIKWDESKYIFVVITLDDILLQLYRIALNATADFTYRKYNENKIINHYDIEKATKRAIHVQEGCVVSDIDNEKLAEIESALLNKGYLIHKDNGLVITQTGLAQFIIIRESLLSKAFTDAQRPLKKWIEGMSSTNEDIEIFLSYCWNDSDLADRIDSLFSGTKISIKRDKREIDRWGSIRAYMDSIQTTDYAIILISDAYLKSDNCMYEIRKVLLNKDYRRRIFPFVTNSARSIYKFRGKIEYISYWEQKYDEAKKEIEKIGNIENAPELVKELRITKEISHSISEFLHAVSDMNNPSLEDFAGN